MTLTRWDPFKDLIQIQERMNRMFEDSLVRSRGDDDPGTSPEQAAEALRHSHT